MMNKNFEFTSTFKSHEDDDGNIVILGMASTKDADRAGDVIEPEAWSKGGLKNFESNPVILFNHDYNHPIGRATGLKVTPNGLEMKAKISKNAKVPSGAISDLIKDGVLGAFSVGFRIKDADYLEETDGLKIKDAELFEVSVVSVPCNQAATFSLAKSFDSDSEFQDFKKQFINGEDLAGQSLAKDEDSLIASGSPERGDKAQKEIVMDKQDNSPAIDLDAIAAKAAAEAAEAVVAKMAVKEAEAKAAEKAAAEAEAKAAAEAAEKAAEVESVIKTGIESGTERLAKDLEAKFSEENANLTKALAEAKEALDQKADELAKMAESKAVFADRGNEAQRIEKNARELMYAQIAGVATGKGWNNSYSNSILEKAGVTYTATTAAGIDVVVERELQKEIELELRLASLFREMPVESQSTVLPLQTDVNLATWANGGRDGADDGSGTDLANRGNSNNTYNVQQKVVQVDRLISTAYLDDFIDEKVLPGIMPMLVQGIARSHARATDAAFLNGNGANITGLIGSDPATLNGFAVAGASWGAAVPTDLTFSAQVLVKSRRNMGVYGLRPEDCVFVVSQDKYYDLLEDPDFQTIDEVGSDMAVRLTGQVGMVYGSPVVLTDNMPADTEDGFGGALAINTSNFIVPRLRGVRVEQDREVANQRIVLVGTQHLGFDELFTSTSGKAAVTSAIFNAV